MGGEVEVESGLREVYICGGGLRQCISLSMK